MLTKTKTETPADRFAMAAVYAGCPRDQIETFTRAGYIPTSKQLEFHAAARQCDDEGGPTKIGFGGRRGPGKSHAAFAQAVLDDCQRFAGLKVLFLRKVGKAAKESFEDLRQNVLFATPHDYSAHRGLLTLPNGSRIITGHFNSDKDIDAYLGVEYDEIVVEEANTLTATKLTMLFGSLRTSKEGWRPRAYLTFNPGGIGHGQIKRQFILPHRRQAETDTRFIPAGVYDNPFIDDGYRRYLESLTGWLRRAWLDGDWDISAGQFFSNWREDLHVVEPFDVPLDWTTWASLDYGFVHYTVVHLLAMSGDGKVYLVDEFAARRQLVPQNVAGIKQMLDRNNRSISSLDSFVAGSDVFAQRGTSNETIADQYGKAGIELAGAKMDRINGWSIIMQMLGDSDEGIEPSLLIFNRCHRVIDTLPMLEHNPRNPEDVLKTNVDDHGMGGDDAPDCLRYGLQEIPTSSSGFYFKYT